MKTTVVKKIIFSLALVLLISIGAVWYWRSYRPRLIQIEASREYQAIAEDYYAMTPANANFRQAAKRTETFLNRYTGALSPKEEAAAKIILASSLPSGDRIRMVETLKEVAQSREYPSNLRALAINLIVDDYEINFTDLLFARREIFSGGDFAKALNDAGGDEILAIRKLNEWSLALFPTAIPNYRIAKWYASQIYKNPQMTEGEKVKLLSKVGEYLLAGDRIPMSGSPPQREGLAYELKARTVALSGGTREEAERFFKLAMETYQRPPQTVFQILYLRRSSLFYAAFLARNYGMLRTGDIQTLLKPHYELLSTPQGLEQRPRLVAFLAAARDSANVIYPAPDFNKSDIKQLQKIYPEFGKVVEGLTPSKD